MDSFVILSALRGLSFWVPSWTFVSFVVPALGPESVFFSQIVTDKLDSAQKMG